MRARLLCKTGEHAGQEHQLADDNVIGRSQDSDVLLQSTLISGRHARIFGKQGAFYLEDLDSANGTWLDGHRISGPVRLDRLNVITIAGRFDYLFQALDVQAEPQPKGEPAPQERPVAQRDRAPAAAAPSPPAAKPPSTTPPAEAGPPMGSATQIGPSDLAPLPKLRKPGSGSGAAPSEGARTPREPAEGASRTRVAPADFDALPELRRPAARASTGAGQSDVEPSEAPPGGPGTQAAPANLGELPELVRKPARTPASTEQAGRGQGEEPPDAARTQAAPSDLSALPDLVGKAAARYALEVVIADGVTAIFDLHEGRNTLGRANDCEVSVNDLLVSRYHAVLTVGDKVVLEDTGSDNGIEIAGQRITRAEIKVGTVFKLGPRMQARLVQL